MGIENRATTRLVSRCVKMCQVVLVLSVLLCVVPVPNFDCCLHWRFLALWQRTAGGTVLEECILDHYGREARMLILNDIA